MGEVKEGGEARQGKKRQGKERGQKEEEEGEEEGGEETYSHLNHMPKCHIQAILEHPETVTPPHAQVIYPKA